MPQTKLANLVDPQVMADMVSAKLPKKIKFSPIARVDTTLVGRPEAQSLCQSMLILVTQKM